MQAYPAIELDLDFSDAMVNIVSDGFDAAVRTGELADSSLMRRKLCTFRRLLVASPAYLARHGRPADGIELMQHQRLDYRFPATGRLEQWPLMDEAVQPVPGMVCNSVEMRVYLAVQGQGVAYLPAFAVQRELAAGQLVSLLDEHTAHGILAAVAGQPPPAAALARLHRFPRGAVAGSNFWRLAMTQDASLTPLQWHVPKLFFLEVY